MNAAHQTRVRVHLAQLPRRSRRRLRSVVRAGLWRVAPAYAARRSARTEAVFRLARLDKELERQGEQLERLEDLVSELVLTAESLRREIADAEAAQAGREAAGEGPVEG